MDSYLGFKSGKRSWYRHCFDWRMADMFVVPTSNTAQNIDRIFMYVQHDLRTSILDVFQHHVPRGVTVRLQKAYHIPMTQVFADCVYDVCHGAGEESAELAATLINAQGRGSGATF